MPTKNRLAIAIIAFAFTLSGLSGQSADAALSPTVSQKQDMAIFGLGTYGYPIPLEVLGRVDLDIQKVFVDLGRFNVIGYQQRLSSADLPAFEEAIKQSKQGSVVIPDKYQFGEALLTQAEWNRLVGAFIVAVPVVGGFDSQYNQKTFRWEASITVDVTFLDVASGGSVLGQAHVVSSGSSKSNQFQSISDAVGGIASQLTFEIRKIDAFQIRSKVVAVKGDEVRMALGRNMGVTVGDEFAIERLGMVAGLRDDREVGLIVIKNVGAEVSTGRAIYGAGEADASAQLREIPRLGVDFDPYLHLLGMPGSWAFLPGVRAVVSRGFYDVRPYVAAQIPVGQVISVFTALFVPVNVTAGAEYDLGFGRLTLTAYAGIGASYVHFFEAISSTSTDTDFFSHVGAQAWGKVSWLFTRDLRVFVEGGVEGWLPVSPFFSGYGGLGFGAGADLKL